MKRRVFMLASVLLLCGCAGLRMAGQPDSRLEEREVIQLIAYAQRVAAMSSAEQRREYDASNKSLADGDDPGKRVRLALLLGTPGASVQDTERAARLLEPLAASDDATSPLRSLARLLHAQLGERAREQLRTEHLRGQLEARKEAENAMRRQLDELKEVERAILQRTRESQFRRR